MAALTEAEFVGLVQRAEQEVEKNIGAYKIRLALFAMLGYVVIFVVLMLLITLVGGSIAIAFVSSSLLLLLIKSKLIFVILAAIWTFLKALWIKFDLPEGYSLERKDCPELFNELDQLSKSLNALKIHKVILMSELNASVVQYPRFGVLGGQVNYLMLGLELMLTLSPEQMRSVLAHELGHLSGNHSKFSGWIYRVRISWQRVMEAFHQSESFGAGLMRKFFDWYAPKFSAYSFALARQNEYEADAVAAKLTSNNVAAQALVNLYATAPYVDEKYWSMFFRQADTIENPPHAPFEGLSEFMRKTPLGKSDLVARVKHEMQKETHYADTHPALKYRVKALNPDKVIPETLKDSAAQVWFAKNYAVVLKHFDSMWIDNNKQRWNQRYQYVTNAKAAMASFNTKEPGDLTDDELWSFASYTHEFSGDEAALPLYQVFQQREPDSIGAAFYIGRILMDQEKEEALPHLRMAFKSPHVIKEAAERGYYLLNDILKRPEDAEQWWNDAVEVQRNYDLANAERQSASPKDEYVKPEIDEAVVEEIKRTLAAHKNAGKAWLAQKVTKYQGEPVYIVSFRPRGFYWSYARVQRDVTAAFKMDIDLFVVCLWGDSSKLGKKVRKKGIPLF